MRSRRVAEELIDKLLLETPFTIKYLGTSDRDTLLWVAINDTTYIYDRAPNADPIKEIARKFEKMLQYGPGKALAWLKKNTVLRGKVPTSQAKSKMKESSKKSVKEAEARDVAVGDVIKYNNHEWKVAGVRQGKYILTTLGLPPQNVNYLVLNQWVDQGKATVIHRSVEALAEDQKPLTKEDRLASINELINSIASKYHIDPYKLTQYMDDAHPVTVVAARAVVAKAAGDYTAHQVSPDTLADLVSLYAQDELMQPDPTPHYADADDSGGFEDKDHESRTYPDNTGYF